MPNNWRPISELPQEYKDCKELLFGWWSGDLTNGWDGIALGNTFQSGGETHFHIYTGEVVRNPTHFRLFDEPAPREEGG